MARLLGEGSPPPAAGHPDHSGQLVQRGEDRSSSGEQDADRGRTFVRSQAEPSAHAAQAIPASVADTVHSPGQPLQPTVRQEMASRLGADFAAVRTHTDAAASRSAADIGARAYTAGSHIVFRAGEYQPSTPTGRQLLAHELTHVIQQRHGPVTGTGSGLTISNPADRFEREAEATAARVMSGPLSEEAILGEGASNTAQEAQRAGHQVQRQVGNPRVTYGTLTNDAGTRMEADIFPGPRDKGSKPTVKPPWWPPATPGAPGTPSKETVVWFEDYMVQGHLLNQQLGGPGNTMENLTPITASTNSQHSAKVEQKVISHVKNNQILRYHVDADYSTHPKKEDLVDRKNPNISNSQQVIDDLDKLGYANMLAGQINAEYTAYDNKTGNEVGGDRWEIKNEGKHRQ